MSTCSYLYFCSISTSNVELWNILKLGEVIKLFWAMKEYLSGQISSGQLSNRKIWTIMCRKLPWSTCCSFDTPANSHSWFQSIFAMSVPPVNQILSFGCVLHCPDPSTIICLHFYNAPLCVFVFADNENPFLPLPSKYDRWQTKGRSVFLNFLQGHQMGIIIVYVSGLPGPLRRAGPRLALPHAPPWWMTIKAAYWK